MTNKKTTMSALKLEITELNNQLKQAQETTRDREKSITAAQREINHFKNIYRMCCSLRSEIKEKLTVTEKARDDAIAEIKTRDETIASLQHRIASLEVYETKTAGDLAESNDAIISLAKRLAKKEAMIAYLETGEKIRLAKKASQNNEDEYEELYSN